jgi:protein involved in polysaccharide export with SLBB domain
MLGPAATAFVFAAWPAGAQLASPVAGDAQASGTGERSPAATQTAIPSPREGTTFQPAVIENTPPDPADTPPAISTESDVDRHVAPPSEFESFVSEAAGTPVRRFGAELLLPGARGFPVPPTTAVPDDYRLNPGDQLQLGLSGSVQAANLRLTVDSEGRIFVPRVGGISVAGVRYGDLHDVIARQITRQYRGFDLQVTIARLRGITVYVTGFANRPGSYSVSSLSTLVNAVLAAGGPASGGSLRSIQLRRGGKLVSDFDLYDLLLKGDKSGDAVLQNGDVIYIAPAGAQVAVVGAVNRQAIFEVGTGETLQDAVLYAGGVSTVADNSRLMVLDSLGQRDTGWKELNAADARTRPAQRGDIIRILSNVGIARPLEQQSILVTVSGEVAHPGRYYFRAGTRLGDVVAQAGGLTQGAFPFASIITRDSVRRQQRVSYDRAIKDMELQLSTQPLVSADRARAAQAGNPALIKSVVSQLRTREPDGRLVFDLPVTATALPEDLVLENNDTIYVPPRPVTVGVFGAVPSPASFAYRDGMTIGAFVRAAGGVQKLGDKGEVFVVRANGTVLANGKRVLREPALPGDLIFVPVDSNRGEFWARLRDITGSLFGGVTGAATIAALLK